MSRSYIARTICSLTLVCYLATVAVAVEKGDGTPLSGTKPLTIQGDITSQLVDGVDKFLLQKLEESVAGRAKHWQRDFSSAEAYNKSIEPNRRRLAHVLGVRDQRLKFDAPELVATTGNSALVGKGKNYEIHAVRWPVLGHPGPNWPNLPSIYGEGLLLVPVNGKPVANVVAIPDADQTPEQIVGLTSGVAPESQFARRLAESGCRVLVPTLISREMMRHNGRANLSKREYAYRASFVLGWHLIGYEVQKVLAGVDWFSKDSLKTGVIGYGEGGAIALYAAALDTRIDAVSVSGYFDSRQTIWQQPIDRNVFTLLREFGDAELASMVQPRTCIIEAAAGPTVTLSGAGGGAPAELKPADLKHVQSEVARAEKLTKPLAGRIPIQLVTVEQGKQAFGSDRSLSAFAKPLGVSKLNAANRSEASLRGKDGIAKRQQRQIDQIDRHNQLLLRESPFVRKEFMKNLDTTSVKAYEKSTESYRKIFYDDVIGRFSDKVLPFNPRSRKTYVAEKWTGYEVVLDVYPNVIAYGVLLVPNDVKFDGSDKRPVVVCQHGLEGRPTDTFLNDHRAYHDFAAKLAERGFVTFAPQNLYIFKDRFRTLQRKANPLGKTLFSVIVPQHQQIVDWLQSQPFVDPDRIAFYGLSYGGKTAMRVPALVTDYALSICSADFNEWVLKNASTRHRFSYMGTGEYEIFEFDLGSTFNYAEMAALICPRPFMVERGHFDGVGTDEWVAHEFAKIRNLYQARLDIGDRTEIEWFVGPHTINGQGTYDFLHKHLKWPKK